MGTLKLLEWLVLLVYFAFFNVGWIYGCRHYMRTRGGLTYGSAATTMLMTIITVYFLISTTNKINLLWITPVLIFSNSFNYTLFRIPILGGLYFTLAGIFFSLVTLGVRPNEDARQILDQELMKVVDNIIEGKGK